MTLWPRAGDRDVAAAPAAKAGPAKAAERAPVLASARTDCGFDRLLKAGPGDGEVRWQDEPPASEVSSLILRGKEAAAGGQRRDAESAFLMACRAAERKTPADPLQVADAKYQLGRHYAAVVLAETPPPKEIAGQAARRADALYSDALQVYMARHGAEHEKTRFAQEGLRGLRASADETELARASEERKPQERKQKPAAKPAEPPAIAKAPPPPAPAVVAKKEQAPPEPRPQAAPPKQAAAPKPAPVRPPPVELPRDEVVAAPAAAPVRPSFDCAKARSTPEKIICADPELARMDRELGRLHARARAAAPDERAFQQRSDAAWQRREDTCRDRECLRDWYQQRRSELASDSNG
jgi:hypothetical protein